MGEQVPEGSGTMGVNEHCGERDGEMTVTQRRNVASVPNPTHHP